jgi:hypothetical protein
MPVVVPQVGIGPALRNGPAFAQILRELRVIRRGKAAPRVDTGAASGDPERSLGGDMNCVGRIGREQFRQPATGTQGKTYLRVSRARNCAELIRRE